VDDTIRGLVMLAESGEHLPVNIGNPDHELTMLQLAQTVVRVTGSSSEITFEASPYDLTDDPQVRRPDITRARELLGWQPEVDLEEGLRRWLTTMGTEVARV
jgi:dTDP-glucose 4,6-dehydratase